MGAAFGLIGAARCRHAARGANGAAQTAGHGACLRRGHLRRLIRAAALALALGLSSLPLGAADRGLRVATWNIGLTRQGPGLLLRDIGRGDDAQIAATVTVLRRLDADVLLLTGFDHDHALVALDAYLAVLAKAGLPYPYRFALDPNTGVPTGLDLDGNGRRSEPRDAQGWGHFPGAAGMAILSRLPIDAQDARDFSGLLWADLPDTQLPPALGDKAGRILRLSTTGHWDVPVRLPDGSLLHLLAWYATPPVFDGPDDRNGLRNHDEAAFWSDYLDHRLDLAPPDRFILIGDANLDPDRGEGRPAALRALLRDPRIADPVGPAPTVDYGPPLGPMRMDYVLPAAALPLRDAGVLFPDPQEGTFAATLATASRHWPVWVDLALP